MADPMATSTALFRDMLGQWEKLTNDLANQAMGSSEFSRAMHGATAATLKVQAATHEAMAKMLAAANLPSRADVAGLGQQMQALDERLARIESALAAIGATPALPARPKPPRTRKPAAK